MDREYIILLGNLDLRTEYETLNKFQARTAIAMKGAN